MLACASTKYRTFDRTFMKIRIPLFQGNMWLELRTCILVDISLVKCKVVTFMISKVSDMFNPDVCPFWHPYRKPIQQQPFNILFFDGVHPHFRANKTRESQVSDNTDHMFDHNPTICSKHCQDLLGQKRQLQFGKFLNTPQ